MKKKKFIPFKSKVKDKKDCHYEDRKDLPDKYFGKVITIKDQSNWIVFSDDLPFGINEESIIKLDYKKPLKKLRNKIGMTPLSKLLPIPQNEVFLDLDIIENIKESNKPLSDKQLKICKDLWEKYNKK